MRLSLLSVVVCGLFESGYAFAGLVEDTRAAMAAGNFAVAEKLVDQYGRARGSTPELAQAVSWLARGALAAKNYERADSYATQARRSAVQLLGSRKLDSDPYLPGAIGNSIDVHAYVLNSRGDTAAALAYLSSEYATYGKTGIAERIQKTVNVLSLEGKPAPPLESKEWLGGKPPMLASLKGKPVLLFFWAHWCPDCKAAVPLIAKMMQSYGPKGLVLVSPTRYYGYTATEENATPLVEKPYIEKIRKQYYAPLGEMTVPLSNANFLSYGSASTPTIVLVDRAGIVRWYHPGGATEQELVARIDAVMK